MCVCACGGEGAERRFFPKIYDTTFQNVPYSKRVTQRKLPFSGVAALNASYALWHDVYMLRF